MPVNPVFPIDDYTKAAYEILVQWDRNSVRLWKELTQMQFDWARLCLECWSKQAKSLSEEDSPARVLAVQSRMAAEFTKSVLDGLEHHVHLMAEAQPQLAAYFTAWREMAERTEIPAVSKTKGKGG